MCYAVSWYVFSPDITTATISGGAVGLALLTKLTNIVYFGLLPAVAMTLVLVMRRQVPRRPLRARFGHLLIFGALAIAMLNAGYLFKERFRRLADFEFCSRLLEGEEAGIGTSGNRFRESWLGSRCRWSAVCVRFRAGWCDW